MAKIIIPGKTPSTVRRFRCKRCGCVFEADKRKYKVEEQLFNCVYYCKCPCCSNNAFEERKKEI